MSTATCSHCGGTRLEPGSVQSTGKIHFRPEHAKFLTLRTANVDIEGVLCIDCGHLQLQADLEKVRALLKDEDLV